MERALHDTLQAAQDYRKQLETVLTRSNDAIAQVQEGILVDANQSWLDLIAAPMPDAVVGQPVMDFFEEGNHIALKGALVACQQGRWNDHSLRADLRTADGGAMSLELVLTLGERDGEPCVRLIVPSQRRERPQHRHGPRGGRAAQSAHPGLLYRQPLLEAMQKRVETAVQGGCRYVSEHRPGQLRPARARAGRVPQRGVHLSPWPALVRVQLAPTRHPRVISAAPACWR